MELAMTLVETYSWTILIRP